MKVPFASWFSMLMIWLTIFIKWQFYDFFKTQSHFLIITQRTEILLLCWQPRYQAIEIFSTSYFYDILPIIDLSCTRFISNSCPCFLETITTILKLTSHIRGNKWATWGVIDWMSHKSLFFFEHFPHIKFLFHLISENIAPTW